MILERFFKRKKHKYRATTTEVDGIKFSSKAEAHYYQKLLFLKQSGKLNYFLRQVPFHLPGGVKYVCDFIEFWSDGQMTVTDVKGYETQEYKTKKKIVESLYPIKINVVKNVKSNFNPESFNQGEENATQERKD